MSFTQAQIKELEDYFSSANMPKKIQLYNNAVTFHNLPRFVRNSIENLKDEAMSRTVMILRHHDLLEIKKYLEERKG